MSSSEGAGNWKDYHKGGSSGATPVPKGPAAPFHHETKLEAYLGGQARWLKVLLNSVGKPEPENEGDESGGGDDGGDRHDCDQGHEDDVPDRGLDRGRAAHECERPSLL